MASYYLHVALYVSKHILAQNGRSSKSGGMVPVLPAPVELQLTLQFAWLGETNFNWQSVTYVML